jgi:DNA polymerase III sliding clamp (beta) subunit (PCNA family)
MPVEGFPAARNTGEQKAMAILDNAAFSSALSIVCPFAGDGLSHLWNTSLLILDDSKNMTLAACDGKQFARIVLPSSGSAFKTATPAKIARSLVALFQAQESLTMSVGENHLTFDMEGLLVQLQQADLKYPDEAVLQVCDKTAQLCNHEVTLERDRLISELQAAGGLMERDELQVRIGVTVSPQALTVSADSKSSADHSIAIETKATHPLSPRRINHANMVSILRSLDCERVTMFYNYEAEPNGFRLSPEGSSCVQVAMIFFKDL